MESVFVSGEAILPCVIMFLKSSIHVPMLLVSFVYFNRIVKIFRDILLKNPAYKGRAPAMHCMLQRAADRKEDDGVRDLVHETLHTLWFNTNAFNLSTASSDPSSKSKFQAGVKAQFYCREAATQMVEVVKFSGNPEVLASLVKGLLFGFDEGDKDKKVAERKKRQEDALAMSQNLVSSLIELLLAFEESRTNNDDDGKELVAILSTLGVFSQSYPDLMIPHIDTLIPYLKGDNGAKKYEAAIVGTVSGIISRVASHISVSELNRLTSGELPTDLVNIAYKFPGEAISSAVETLCKLANHRDAKPGSIQEKKLLKLAVQVRLVKVICFCLDDCVLTYHFLTYLFIRLHSSIPTCSRQRMRHLTS